MDEELKARELLEFQLNKETRALFKRFLTLVEDLREDHKVMVQKLEKNLPEQYHPVVRALDYFDDSRFNHVRKRILDSGNETLRNVDEQIGQFKIQF